MSCPGIPSHPPALIPRSRAEPPSLSAPPHTRRSAAASAPSVAPPEASELLRETAALARGRPLPEVPPEAFMPDAAESATARSIKRARAAADEERGGHVSSPVGGLMPGPQRRRLGTAVVRDFDAWPADVEAALRDELRRAAPDVVDGAAGAAAGTFSLADCLRWCESAALLDAAEEPAGLEPAAEEMASALAPVRRALAARAAVRAMARDGDSLAVVAPLVLTNVVELWLGGVVVRPRRVEAFVADDGAKSEAWGEKLRLLGRHLSDVGRTGLLFAVAYGAGSARPGATFKLVCRGQSGACADFILSAVGVGDRGEEHPRPTKSAFALLRALGGLTLDELLLRPDGLPARRVYVEDVACTFRAERVRLCPGALRFVCCARVDVSGGGERLRAAALGERIRGDVGQGRRCAATPAAHFYEAQPHALPWDDGDAGRADACGDAGTATLDLGHVLTGGPLPPPRGVTVGLRARAARQAGELVTPFLFEGRPIVNGLPI